MREGGLLAWQWSLYGAAHRDRRNLLLHVVTVPLFMAGCLTLLTLPWAGPSALLSLIHI